MSSPFTRIPFVTARCARRLPTGGRRPLARCIVQALVRVVLISGAGLAHGTDQTEWIRVDTEQPRTALQRYINLDTVRQTGPMSIYRRVQELSQAEPGAGPVPSAGPASIVQTVEYDCMSGKARIVQELGFSLPWGKGNAVPLPAATTVPAPRLNEWRASAEHPSGAKVLAAVCPGEPDS